MYFHSFYIPVVSESRGALQSSFILRCINRRAIPRWNEQRQTIILIGRQTTSDNRRSIVPILLPCPKNERSFSSGENKQNEGTESNDGAEGADEELRKSRIKEGRTRGKERAYLDFRLSFWPDKQLQFRGNCKS